MNVTGLLHKKRARKIHNPFLGYNKDTVFSGGFFMEQAQTTPAIRITAEVLRHDIRSCKFEVDRPVLPDAFARFTDKEKAQGSPLAAHLFAIEGVSRVDIMENTVTVTKNIAGD